ncbi:MEDS domain-containing protein [Methanofollis fontis]|uniref:Uncharacterized protein n=1 Tax=Methanofollis fontis TaxID=2052832 RepID=A0A483CS79_9EURY|nr:MEDS domain-containing protein [Methanofollis fontis]TAJ45194.1 hypothetical protein CUJ86_00100 [Methanofollis fontis]
MARDLMRASMFSRRDIYDLSPGSHVCCIYDVDEEWWSVVESAIRCGLERGERIVCFIDRIPPEAMIGGLSEGGLPLDDLIGSGQVMVGTAESLYLSGGQFDPIRMSDYICRTVSGAIEDGFPALRMIGDASWALRHFPGSDRLFEYEAAINTLLGTLPCTAFCLYDRRIFPASALLDALMAHPKAMIGEELYDNHYFCDDHASASDTQDQTRLSRWISHLVEKKRYEAEIVHQRDEAEAYFTTSAVAMVVIDGDGLIRRVNPSASTVFGLNEHLLMGRTLLSFVPPEWHGDARKCIGSDAEAAKNVVIPVTPPGGEVRYVRWNASPLPHDGMEGWTLLSGEDITERRRIEENLRKNERIFSAIFHNSSVPKALVDASGTVIDANGATSRFLGVDELIGRQIPGFITAPGGVGEEERSFLRPDAETVWGLVSISDIGPGVDGEGPFIVVCQDITERKRFEEERFRALEQIERNMTQLASLNDRIRNPLAVIVAVSDMDVEESEKSRILEQAEIINGIVDEIDRGWCVSESVRDFLRKHNEFSA